MAKIVKNNLGNFLVICLIFFIIFGWIFSGWPQIREAQAAITVGNVTPSSADSNSFSFTHNHNKGTNGLLVVSVMLDSGDKTVSGTPTYGGNDLILLRAGSHSTEAKPRVEIWHLKNPPTGDNTVSVSLTASDKTTVVAVSYGGVDQDIPIDNDAIADNSTSGSGDPTITITSESGDLVQDAVASYSADGSITMDGSQTELWNEEIGGAGASGHPAGGSYEKASGDTVSMDWTHGENKDWVSIGFNINTPAGALTVSAPSSVTFGAVNYSFSGQNSTGNTFGNGTPIQVEDSTGSGAGWTVIATCQDWTGPETMDYDGDGSATGQLTINQDSVTVTKVSGQDIDPTYGPKKGSTDSFDAGTSEITIGLADSGYGQGTYDFKNYDLQQFIPGMQNSGDYNTTLTVTVS